MLVNDEVRSLQNIDADEYTKFSMSGKQYDNQLADYTQLLEEPVTRVREKDGVNYEITYYTITFAKKVNGYFSSDYIAVKVTSKGTLASIMMGDLNAFENATIDFDVPTLNQSISDKIESAYKGNEINVKDSTVNYQRIVLTPDGEICMYSDVDIDVTDASNVETKTRIIILTVLGKKN